MNDSDYDVIHSIMEQFPQSEWFDRCRKALPDVSDSNIFSTIVALSGGDAREVNEEE